MMRIDRSRFLALAAALASSACPGARAPQPQPLPTAPPDVAKGSADTQQSSAERCAMIDARVGKACVDGEPADDPRARCAAYAEAFVPAVASRAIDCLLAMPSEAICDDRCVAYECGRGALRGLAVDADAKERCRRVEAGCQGMGALCEQYLPGMNKTGRDQLTGCLLERCGLGIDLCLGHSGYHAACVEEAGAPL